MESTRDCDGFFFCSFLETERFTYWNESVGVLCVCAVYASFKLAESIFNFVAHQSIWKREKHTRYDARMGHGWLD